MYWSNDISSGPRLERAGLDGVQRHTVIAGVPHVSSLTIDYSQRRLYWLRASCNCIEFSGMSGDDRQLLVTGLQQPFGIAQYSDRVYWTDWIQQSIESVDKLTGSDRHVLLDRLSFPIHLSIVHISRQLGTSISFSSNSVIYLSSVFKFMLRLSLTLIQSRICCSISDLGRRCALYPSDVTLVFSVHFIIFCA